MARHPFILLVILLLLSVSGDHAFTQSGSKSAPPVINVWYGNTQEFGQPGNPVPAINILGNVSATDGLLSLRYTLNGSDERMLSVGRDTRRLLKRGDFNIDIPYNTLLNGPNEVIVIARDSLSQVTRDTVTVEFTQGIFWPGSYVGDWSTATRISDVAQVVDGKWAIESNGLRTIEVGYDRIIGVGEVAWTDYEATVPITILALDSSGFQFPSNGAGIGFIARWPGHSDLPVSLAGRQPKTGYLPLGAIGWYHWGMDMIPRLKLLGNNIALIDQDLSGRQLAFNTTYMYKMRVETIPGQGALYRMKVWEQGQPEPVSWDLSGQQGLSDPQAGSLMIMAHHIDVLVGNVVVEPLGPNLPPTLSNIQHLPTSGHASITWGTDQAANSSVAYGLTPAYEIGTVTSNPLVLQHEVSLSGLIPNTVYHYRIASSNGNGQASSGNLTFTTTPPSNIVSDDFNAPALNTLIWAFVNPLDDASYEMTNTNTPDASLTISVPGGTAHEPWTGGVLAPRVVQNINNADFEIEFKTLTGMMQRFQQQGIVLQQSGKDFLRFEFFSDGANTRLLAASLVNSVPTIRGNTIIAPNNSSPLFMRIARAGNQWTQRYSFDGQTWVDGMTFSHPITVSQLGLYVANSGSPVPAFTASHDYFFNTASPIDPEDGLAPAIVQHPANQTVVAGQTATFSVIASGSNPLSYQWQKNGANIDGATSASYTSPPVLQSDNGSRFRCLVSNAAGSVLSNEAALVVTEPDQFFVTTSTCDCKTRTFQHTTAGDLRLLIVGISLETGDPQKRVRTVRYRGISLTRLAEVRSPGGDPRVDVWYLVNPPAGTYPVTVTLTEKNKMLIGAASFTGVNQADPITGVVTGGSATGSPNLTVTSSAGNTVMDVVASLRSSISPAAGQTTLWNMGMFDSGKRGGASTKPGASPTVNMRWSGNEKWAGVGFNINRASTVMADGESGVTKQTAGTVPEQFALLQNFPNPFNPSTVIRFEIPEPADVTLRVYNMLGQEVSTLVDAQHAPGTYDVQFDASSLTSGVYLYRLQAGGFVETRRLILIK